MKNVIKQEAKAPDEIDQSTQSIPSQPADSKLGTKPKMSKRKKRIIVIAAILLAVLLVLRIVVPMGSEYASPSAPVNVKISHASMDSIYATAPISGRIEPIKEAAIIPLAQGEITAVHVELGQKVSKGTVLFEIDKTQLSTTYNQTKNAFDTAAINYDRMKLLYNEGAISLQAFEQAETQYNTAKESYRAASDAYNNCTVTSPIDGYVTSLTAAVGNIASSAAPAATIADVSSLEINTSVSDRLISKIHLNDTVEIYISSLGKEPYEGVVTAISPAPGAGSLTYPIKISLTDAGDQILAGMFAEIQIKSDSKSNVLCIPSDAVIIKGGRSIVVKLTGDIPSYSEVSTGLDNGEFVEITKGLKEGDTIVTLGQQYVTEGVAVNIVKE